MQKSGSIGIDVGATKTLFALFNNRFQALEEIKIKTEETKRETFTKTLRESVASLLKKASKHRLTVAAGIKSHATPEAQQGLQIVTAKLKNHAVTTGAQNLQWTVRRVRGRSPPRFVGIHYSL
jgi:predicted NBD/HSP70 family sugar kinase